MGRAYSGLEFSEGFLNSFVRRDLTSQDRSAILKALRHLNSDEKLPSLRVHKLAGTRPEVWSASANKSLRITFLRLGDGRKLLLACTKHYDR